MFHLTPNRLFSILEFPALTRWLSSHSFIPELLPICDRSGRLSYPRMPPPILFGLFSQIFLPASCKLLSRQSHAH